MTILLCEEVLVRVRAQDREECMQRLTVKILSGSANNALISSHKPSVMVPSSSISVELTSDSDLLFYYSLKLADSDFHMLKLEQRLLVDFNRFPDMIKQLLLNEAQMSLVLQVEETKNEAILSITEANQFRELNHLSLRLRKGNDDSVKAYLATRLSHFKSLTSDLESEVSCLRSEVDRLRSDKDSSFTELNRLKFDSETAVSAIQANWKSQIAQLKEDHARELRNLHLSETEEVKERDSRTRQLERQVEELRINSVSLENNFRTSQRRVTSLERELEAAREQAKRRDLESKELTCMNFQLEKKNAELFVHVNTLRAQLGSKETLEVSLTSSRANIAEFSERIRFLEQSAEEKERQLSKLSLKNKELKLMVKEARGALLQQEQVVISLKKEIGDQQTQSVSAATLNDEIAKLKSQIGESQQMLESNSHVISYLNKKLSDRGDPSSLLLTSTIPQTPQLATPVIPEYPNRSNFVMKQNSIAESRILELSLPQATSLSAVSAATPSRIFSGQVKFTARNGGKEPILK